MKLCLFLLLCLNNVPIALQVVRHDYHLITTPATWLSAQTYCRRSYKDLATVVTNDDFQRLNAEAERKGLPGTGWVGLFINVVDWYWSYKRQLITGITFWGTGQPDNAAGHERCVAIQLNGNWADYDCTALKPYICFTLNSGYFAVPTLMSWWGGQTYCRNYFSDLAMITTTTENNQVQQLASQLGSTSWIGVSRDPWWWSDRTVPGVLQWKPGFPNNVDQNDNCALVESSLFMDKPCDTLFNFFCHTPYKVKYKVLNLLIQGDKSGFDPVVQSAILEKIMQKLKDHDFTREIKVTWRMYQDGSIFHKKRIRVL